MADVSAGEKLKVFISYSRRDSAAFADELMAGLEYGGFAPFLDRHDIAAGEDWEARLGGQRRIAWLLGAVAVLVLAMVGYVTWQSYDLARREINVFTARAANLLNDEQFDRAMRYALQAYPPHRRLPWNTPFSTELEGKLAGGAQSTRLYRLLNGHSERVVSAAFNGDGKRVVTASYDNTARIWDSESGKEVAVLKGYAGGVTSAAFSGDGRRVVTASYDKTARV